MRGWFSGGVASILYGSGLALCSFPVWVTVVSLLVGVACLAVGLLFLVGE